MNTLFAPLFSSLYRTVRARTIKRIYALQEQEGRQRDLEEVVERGDKKLKKLPAWTYTFQIPQGIGVQFHDLYFPSPLTLAAFKDDLEVMHIWMRLGLGGACSKTVMKEPSKGPRPRLQEATVNGCEGFINAMGLPGHGVEGVIQALEQSNIFSHKRPLGLSVGGSSLEEYQHVFDKLNRYLLQKEQEMRGFEVLLEMHGRKPMLQEPWVPYYFEINVSCPNTPEGQQMTKNPQLLETLLRHMRSETQRVIGVKYSPDTPDSDLLIFAEMVKSFPKTYLNLGNTASRTCDEVGLLDDAISIGKGGLSGPALFNRTYNMIQLTAPMKIPLIATGGIDSAKKVRALQELARPYDTPLLVGMATAVVKDMYCIPRINRALAKNK